MDHAYLEAKQRIDEVSFNSRCRASLDAAATTAATRAGAEGRPVEVVELGAGTGPTAERFARWGIDARLESTGVVWRAWESNPRHAESIRQRLAAYAWISEVHVSTDDLLDLIDARPASADIVVGQAIMDLFAPPDGADVLAATLRPGGIAWLPITYDGYTAVGPTPDADLDRRILDRYERTMRRTPRAGGAAMAAGASHLAHAIHHHDDLELIAAGSSDWVLLPGPPRSEDERTLLARMLRFIEDAVPVGEIPSVSPWIAARRDELERDELALVVHQLDLVVRRRMG